MQRQVLEARVLGIVESVVAGADVEDDRIELKADWPSDARKTARQIAGHANAAGGEPVVWIIGLDEASHRVSRVTPTEVQSWWGQVERCFAELAPEIETLRVPTPGGLSVMALRFETSRAPYLVTTDGRGAVDREVPWRAGNATRSARRSEILRAVVGEAQVPRLEPINASATFRTARVSPNAAQARAEAEEAQERFEFQAAVDCYLEAAQPVTLPEHRWKASLLIGDLEFPVDLAARGPIARIGAPFVMTTAENRGAITYIPDSGLQVDGSDAISVRLHSQFVEARLREILTGAEQVRIDLQFPLAMSARAASLRITLKRAELPRLTDNEPRIAYFEL